MCVFRSHCSSPSQGWGRPSHGLFIQQDAFTRISTKRQPRCLVTRALRTAVTLQLDDAAILFVASNGAITTGSFNPDAWYMPETDIFGRQYNWRGNDDD